MVKNGCNIKDKLIYLLAAVLPVFFMLVAYAGIGFFPFGNKTLYTWDLQRQYSSFMVLMHNFLTGQEHIGYSLIGGLGGSLYGLAAYYLGSPFNIIMVFFDERTMPIGVMVLILMKTAFMGLFMFMYLYGKKKSAMAVLFSTAYAFSAFAIAYQSNIMWMDALVFLPLVIWGVEKLIKEGKCLLYIVSLGLTIISNYFMAYMVCLFVVFYFIGYMVVIEWRETEGGRKWNTVIRFIISSLWGGGLSAFLLLPVICDMQSGMGRQIVKWEALKNGARLFYYRSILPMFLACSYDNSQRQDSMGTFPLLYCGVLTVFGILLFFVIRNISWKLKVFRAFLLGMLLVSCNHMNLFFIWHGFYTPMGAPWRFIFLWSFVALAASYEGTSAFLEGRVGASDYSAVAGTIIFFVWLIWRFERYRGIACFNIVIIFAEVICLFLWKKFGKFSRKVTVQIFCCTILGIELISNTIYTWNQGFEYEDLISYLDHADRMKEAIVKEEGVYRSEIIGEAARSLNDGFLWNINTIGSYTSTSKKKTYDIGICLNIGELRDVRIYELEAPLLSKDIIGLRYIYGGESAGSGYEKVKTTKDGINVFENKNILPFGFLVNETALEITSKDWEKDICEKQNALFHALAGSREMETQDIYKRIPDEENIRGFGSESKEAGHSYSENIELIQKAVKKTSMSTLEVTAEKDSDVTVNIRNDLGERGYVCFSVPYEQGWKAMVDGREVTTVEGMGGLLLVPVEMGEHEVRIIYTAPGSVAGAVVSLISLTGLIVYALYMWKGSMIRRGMTEE